MYAIVKIGGKQVKLVPNTRCLTAKLPYEVGHEITFEEDKILLIEDAQGVALGTPFVKGGKVTAEVMEHVKGDKVIVFKKKRRKGYRVKRGHRQDHTALMIKNITKN